MLTWRRRPGTAKVVAPNGVDARGPDFAQDLGQAEGSRRNALARLSGEPRHWRRLVPSSSVGLEGSALTY